MPRFDIAAFVKEQKRLREKVVFKNRQLKLLQDEISAAPVAKKAKQREFSRIKEKHRRLDKRVTDIFAHILNMFKLQYHSSLSDCMIKGSKRNILNGGAREYR